MNKELQDLFEEAQSIGESKPRQSLKMGKLLVSRGKQEKDYDAIAHGHFIIGTSLFSMGSSQGLMKHATQAVAFFRETNNLVMLVRSLNLQGIAYTAIEEYQMSLMTYREAYEIATENKLGRYRQLVMLNNIAACYFTLGDQKRGVRLMERVYNNIKKKKIVDRSFLFNSTYNLADFHCEMGEYEKSLSFGQECAQMLDEYDNIMNRLLYYVVTTKTYYSMGEKEKGNEWSDKLISLIESGVDTFEVHRDYEKIVLMQLELGEFDRADHYADFLWDVAQENNSLMDQLRASRMQARYFDIQDNTRLSLYYYRKMDAISVQRNQQLLKTQLEIAKNNEDLSKKMREFHRLMKEKQEMEILANKDALTGLLNRNALSKLLEYYVELSKTEGKTVGCIFIDVDCFKEYNDTYGHVEGDNCLLKISKACKSVEDEFCHFARYGGDEFFGIMSGMTDEEVKAKALTITKEVHKCALMHSKSYVSDRITLSVGVLNMKLSDDSNLLDLVNYTDRALYHSKDQGKNCIYMFDNELLKKNDDMHYRAVK